jgi:mitochondrial ATPase complex subunit ATP10
MPPPSSLDIFLTLARRPHARCLHKQLYSLPIPGRRHISSTPIPRTPSLPSRHPNTHAPSSVAAIPLHIGLDRNPTQKSAISKIPIPKGERGENFTPSILSVPLGLPYPAEPGQNSPYDERTFSEKREDYANYTKALERRRVYLRSYLRPYFQEWKRMDFHRGKSFQSNERLLRRDKALYFPNLVGDTLDGFTGMDSCNVMTGKISIVGMQMGRWAEEQVQSFVGEKENEELKGIVERYKGVVQRVHVNMQANASWMWLVKLFQSNLKRIVPEEEWSRYFFVRLPRDVRKGLSEETRDAMGLLNSQVGYVYLVDSAGKIRWAGSGEAWKGERDGLNAAVLRLVAEEAALQTEQPKEKEKSDSRSKPEEKAKLKAVAAS